MFHSSPAGGKAQSGARGGDGRERCDEAEVSRCERLEESSRGSAGRVGRAGRSLPAQSELSRCLLSRLRRDAAPRSAVLLTLPRQRLRKGVWQLQHPREGTGTGTGSSSEPALPLLKASDTAVRPFFYFGEDQNHQR